MRDEQRLKNLYLRIHNGYALTLNDIAFLAEHDKECCQKTCDRIVNGEPEEKIFDAKIELEEAPVSVQDDDRKSIDVLIAGMRSARVNSDTFMDVRASKVMNLIEEQETQDSLQSRRYRYFSSIEPEGKLNKTV